jgi:hypothetical protein
MDLRLKADMASISEHIHPQFKLTKEIIKELLKELNPSLDQVLIDDWVDKYAQTQFELNDKPRFKNDGINSK